MRESISVAFIYGSFAKGDFSGSSDVDVLVVGDVGFDEIVDALRAAEDKLRKKRDVARPSVREGSGHDDTIGEGNPPEDRGMAESEQAGFAGEIAYLAR